MDEVTATAAPETSAAAPAAAAPEATSAPVTTPAATPETAAPAVDAKPEFTSDKDPRQHLSDVLQWKDKHPESEEKKPEAEAVVAPPEVAKRAEEKTEEQKAAEAKAAEAKAAEEAKAPPVEASPYDKSGPLPADRLAAALAEDKALDDALAGKTLKLEDGREINLKDAIFESSRLAAETSEYKELFPTLDAAKEADQGARVFFDLDTKFPAIQSHDDYNSFMMETLLPLSLLRDENGQPIPNPDVPGTFKTDGSMERFVRLTSDIELSQVEQIAGLLEKHAGSNEDAKAYAADLASAVKFINEFRNNGYKMPGTPGDKTAIPPEVQAELDRGRQREAELTKRETAQKKEQHEAFESKVTDETFEKLSPMIQSVLDKSSLTKYEKETVAERVWNDIAEKLSQNPIFKRQMDTLMSRRELSDDVRSRRVAHNLSYMKAVLGGVLDQRLQEAGGKRIANSQARIEKTDTQIQADKMTPRTGAAAPVQQPAQLDSDALHKKAVEQARANNGGLEPNAGQILNEVLALKNKRLTA